MSTSRLRRWLRRTKIYTGSITRVTIYAERDDLPEVPKAGELAVAGNLERLKWALLDCPCGHGHTILLPLQKTANPHWSLSVDDSGRPTLSPSVDRVAERRCHFWLRDGRVQWV